MKRNSGAQGSGDAGAGRMLLLKFQQKVGKMFSIEFTTRCGKIGLC